MNSIRTIVQALKHNRFDEAQAVLDPILQDASRIEFPQAVTLQFSLLDKQLSLCVDKKACEEIRQVGLAKIEAIKTLDIQKESLIDYLDQKLISYACPPE